jgi:arylsulfatase A-like enzyme
MEYRMDQGLGKLVAQLRTSGQLDNTLILFFQDNGGCAEDRGRSPRQNPPTGVVPMGKGELQTQMVPDRSREGLPVLTGPGVMPGPSETYIAYSRAWANVSNTLSATTNPTITKAASPPRSSPIGRRESPRATNSGTAPGT